MSIQKSWSELQTMARACRIVVETLDLLDAAAQPGVTTREELGLLLSACNSYQI